MRGKQRYAGVLAVVVLALWCSGLHAAEKKTQANEQQRLLDVMSDQLSLTDDQKSQIKPILQDLLAKIAHIENEHNAQIEKVLTPDQQTKFKELVKEFRARRGRPGSATNK